MYETQALSLAGATNPSPNQESGTTKATKTSNGEQKKGENGIPGHHSGTADWAFSHRNCGEEEIASVQITPTNDGSWIQLTLSLLDVWPFNPSRKEGSWQKALKSPRILETITLSYMPSGVFSYFRTAASKVYDG